MLGESECRVFVVYENTTVVKPTKSVYGFDDKELFEFNFYIAYRWYIHIYIYTIWFYDRFLQCTSVICIFLTSFLCGVIFSMSWSGGPGLALLLVQSRSLIPNRKQGCSQVETNQVASKVQKNCFKFDLSSKSCTDGFQLADAVPAFGQPAGLTLPGTCWKMPCATVTTVSSCRQILSQVVGVPVSWATWSSWQNIGSKNSNGTRRCSCKPEGPSVPYPCFGAPMSHRVKHKTQETGNVNPRPVVIGGAACWIFFLEQELTVQGCQQIW